MNAITINLHIPHALGTADAAITRLATLLPRLATPLFSVRKLAWDGEEKKGSFTLAFPIGILTGGVSVNDYAVAIKSGDVPEWAGNSIPEFDSAVKGLFLEALRP